MTHNTNWVSTQNMPTLHNIKVRVIVVKWIIIVSFVKGTFKGREDLLIPQIFLFLLFIQ